MSDNNQNDIDRRSLLKGIGATATATAMVGTASAQSASISEFQSEEREELEAEYTPERSRKAVAQYANEVARQLADHGYVDRPTVNAFDLDTFYENETLLDPEDEREGMAVTTIKEDGELTAHVMVSKTTDSHGIGLYVQPQLDRAYALVEALDGSESDVLTAAEEGAFAQDEVSTSSHSGCELGHCCYHWQCSDDGCAQEPCSPDDSACTIYTYNEKKKYCPQPSGATNVYTVGRECDYSCSECVGWAC